MLYDDCVIYDMTPLTLVKRGVICIEKKLK